VWSGYSPSTIRVGLCGSYWRAPLVRVRFFW
jgi:hypothetical protein